MYTVGDPDLQIRKGWGSGHSDPEIRREGGADKKKIVVPSGLILV